MTKYRKINRSLDQSPLLFGVLSFDLLYPIAISFFIAYLIPIGIFHQHWVVGIATFIALVISWAILTAKGSHIFLSRLLQRPPRWIRAIIPYHSLLRELHERDYHAAQKAQTASRKKRSKF
jgi:ABC-type uncharacterized transport system permease subunit